MFRSLALLRLLSGLIALFSLSVLPASGCDPAGPGSEEVPDSSMVHDMSGDAAMGRSDDAAMSDAHLADASDHDATMIDANLADGPALPRGPAPVLLGAAGNYVVLAKTEVSTVPASAVTGDIGLSPAAASFITGFSLIREGAYWTASQVTGKVYAADNDPPTPINLTAAISSMQTAYTDAAGRPLPDFLDLGAGSIGGLILVPGLYKWTSTVNIPSDVTISGGPNDVWILQMTGDLTMSAATKVTLRGGARAKNVFWQVAGVASFGTTAHIEGIVLCKTAIVLRTGASMNGRLLAQTAVHLDGNAVTLPSP